MAGVSFRARMVFALALVAGCDDATTLTEDGGPSTDPAVPDASALRDARVRFDAAARDAEVAVDARMAQDASTFDATMRDAASSETPFGPQQPPNPYAARDGFATQHGDTGASDTTPLAGPGSKVSASALDLLAVCPSILPRKDGTVFAVCTQILNQTPIVYLLDAAITKALAARALIKGDLFGGVYPFLDAQDRLVVVDGANTLLRIAAEDGALVVAEQSSLGDAIEAHCGSTTCDSVVGLAPDYQGNVWYATASGLVGIANQGTYDLKEGVANSIATSPDGTAIVSDHALYLMTASNGAPRRKLRAEYDRGMARKPGQLSWGSGSTPTFFGPRTGSEYLAITDNARPTMNLIVYRTNGDTTPVCTVSVPSPAGDGSENSPIGAGRSVFVTSTYGYPYLALPKDAGASVPESAPPTGGMARIDVRADETCALVWSNEVRSAAVPKLSLGDQTLYTIERQLALPPNASPFDGYVYTALDPATGKVRASQALPGSADPMQLAGTIAHGEVWLQGTTTGITRLVASP